MPLPDGAAKAAALTWAIAISVHQGEPWPEQVPLEDLAPEIEAIRSTYPAFFRDCGTRSQPLIKSKADFACDNSCVPDASLLKNTISEALEYSFKNGVTSLSDDAKAMVLKVVGAYKLGKSLGTAISEISPSEAGAFLLKVGGIVGLKIATENKVVKAAVAVFKVSFELTTVALLVGECKKWKVKNCGDAGTTSCSESSTPFAPGDPTIVVARECKDPATQALVLREECYVRDSTCTQMRISKTASDGTRTELSVGGSPGVKSVDRVNSFLAGTDYLKSAWGKVSNTDPTAQYGGTFVASFTYPKGTAAGVACDEVMRKSNAIPKKGTDGKIVGTQCRPTKYADLADPMSGDLTAEAQAVNAIRTTEFTLAKAGKCGTDLSFCTP